MELSAPASDGGVPVVDVGALVRELGEPGEVDARALSSEALAAADVLHQVCRGSSGGLIAVNHGFEAVVDNALAVAKAFHAAPAEVKAVHAALRLYDAPGNVKIAVRPATLHERFSYPRVVTKDAGIAGLEVVKVIEKLDGADRAPPTAIAEDAPPLFDVPGVDVDGAMRAFQKHILRLALALTRAMAIKLGLEVSAWDRAWAATNSGCTSLHYLPVSVEANTRSDGYSGEKGKLDDDGIGDLGAELRAYPHADGDSMLTLLVHDDVRGLQVLERGDTDDSDVWIDVPRVAPQQVVVQIGQLTQRWTNDEYRATPHRVLKPAAPAPARTTLSCFFRPGIDTVLEVPESLRRPNDAGGVYESVTVAEHLQMPRVDPTTGEAVKLTSNILKDGSWVGVKKPRAQKSATH